VAVPLLSAGAAPLPVGSVVSGAGEGVGVGAVVVVVVVVVVDVAG
jgi:hypothetical protein